VQPEVGVLILFPSPNIAIHRTDMSGVETSAVNYEALLAAY